MNFLALFRLTAEQATPETTGLRGCAKRVVLAYLTGADQSRVVGGLSFGTGVLEFGALCFGLVVGWITYRSLVRSKDAGISDIASAIAAIGGGVITNLFVAGTLLFAGYSVGLALGFFSFLVASWIFDDPDQVMTGSATPSNVEERLTRLEDKAGF